MTGAAPGIVTLLSDFGTDDPYVGIMKGVVLSEHPAATLVDVSHGVPAQNVAVGALYLEHSFVWFPQGSVHLAVVDPGVGSQRAALIARAGGHYFVAPDNGLLSRVAAQSPDFEARRAEPATLGLAVRSRTFHGRDVFARLAARLARFPERFAELGAPHLAASLSLEPLVDDGVTARGRVLAVDHFGNLITDLPSRCIERPGARIELGGRSLRIVGTYSEADAGECVALTSSFGLVEVAVRNGSAALVLGLGMGAEVVSRS